VNTQK